MKKVYPVKIGSIMKQIVANDDVAQKAILESRALSAWREVVGATMAEATQKLTLRDGKLYVVFSSSAARNDFFLRRVSIRHAINDKAGANVVKFIHVG